MPLDELLNNRQWLLWKYVNVPGKVKLDKQPYTHTGFLADVTDPTHWCDYATAYAAYQTGAFNGLGYAISDDDNLTCIDLDDPEGDERIIMHQKTIVKAFDSYSEVSPSGKGLHIWVKGKVESNRLRKDLGVEVYTRKHYMTVTFKPYEDRTIAERQPLIMSLWEQMLTKTSVMNAVCESVQTHTDLDIYTMAVNGKNGALFLDLWQGKWNLYHYPSQSEADFALINIISFYSRNLLQIERMFYQSGLGHRMLTGEKKKSKHYLAKMIHRSFDNQVPEVDTSALRMKMEAASNVERTKANMIIDANQTLKRVTAWDLPPGIVGDIAKFIYEQAPHPFQEIALGGAIGLMAGICGRGYNISGTGLNQYVIVIAGTGTGKEAAASGISKLMQQVCKPDAVPAAVEFLGPSDISSGPALIKQLVETPCFVSMMSEFGLTLQNLSNRQANSSAVSFRKALLELFPRSGDAQYHRPTIYSDKSKNTTIIKSPNFSILAESTPEEFYKTVDEGMVAQGFLPRFVILEYTGNRVHYNEAHTQVQPTPELIRKLSELCVYTLNIMRMGKVNNVAMDAEADQIAREFRSYATDATNNAEMDVEKHLWSRSYLKMMKLAALVAVGVDMYKPVVTAVILNWAKRMILTDISRITERFESGHIGMDQNEVKQREHVVKVVYDFIYRSYDDTMEAYGVNRAMHTDLAIPMSYLSRRLLSNTLFRKDRIGGINSIKRTLDSLIADGMMIEMRPSVVATTYGKSARMYQVVEPGAFKR